MLCQWQRWPWQPRQCHTHTDPHALRIRTIAHRFKLWIHVRRGFCWGRLYIYSVHLLRQALHPSWKCRMTSRGEVERAKHRAQRHSAWTFRWTIWESKGVLYVCINTLFMLLIFGFSLGVPQIGSKFLFFSFFLYKPFCLFCQTDIIVLLFLKIYTVS